MNYINLYFLIILIPTSIYGTTTTTTHRPTDKIWALLAAGSSGYYNYRHQADICHAYQLLKRNGIPNENIIVMMADDIAHNEKNPTPGVLINKPNGTDVYKGVLKDYTGDLVTATNFLNILKGNETGMQGVGSGRVIKSGPNDILFVNFVDHGSPGALYFNDDELYANELYRTLKSMANAKKFRKMVLYIEACHSGSLFDDILEDDTDIFVMTAADPKESSYACYYDDLRETYLGDVFSVNWMDEAERESLDTESLHHLFAKVRTNTTRSHVEEYGDLDIGNTKLSIFFKTGSKMNDVSGSDIEMDMVKSEDVPIAILEKKLRKAYRANDGQSVRKYSKELTSIYRKREVIDKVIDKILHRTAKGNNDAIRKLKQTALRINKANMDCCEQVSKAFSNSCFKISQNPYVGKVLSPLLNTCNFASVTVNDVINEIKSVCSFLSTDMRH